MADGGRIVYYLDVDDSEFNKKLDAVPERAKKAGDSVDRNFGDKAKASFAAFSVSVGLAGIAMGELLRNSVEASNKTQNAFAGLSSATKAYRISMGEAKQAATDLSKDGLISVATSAQSLESLFNGGIGLPEAISLLGIYKDQAAFGKNATLTMDEAVTNLAQSFVTENSAIGNASGQAENYEYILKLGAAALGKNVDALTQSERAQAKVIGTQKLASVVEGNAAKLSETFAGKQAQLKTAFFNLESQIGDVLKLGLTPLLGTIKDAISVNPQFAVSLALAAGAAIGLSLAVVGLVAAIRLAALALGGPLTIILFALSLLVGKVVFGAVQSLQKKMGEATKDFIGGAGGIGKAASEELGGKAAKAAGDLAEKLQDIDDQIRESKSTFVEQLAEMIRASQDKVRALRKDLQEENSDFAASQQEKKKNFDQSVADEVKTLQRRITDIQKSYDKEVASAASANARRLADYNDALAKEKARDSAASRQRLALLQKQYDEEVAKGDKANKSKLVSLLAEIDRERQNTGAASSARIAALTDNYKQEVAIAATANDEKLADFKEQITQEQTDAAESQQRRKEDYDADVLASKTAHDKKVLDTQTQLDAELALQEKHSGDVLAVKDFQFRDEIQKLKDSHAQQLAEFEKQKKAAIKKAQETTDGMADAYNGLPGKIDGGSLNSGGAAIGQDMGKAFNDAVIAELKDLPFKMVFAIFDPIIKGGDYFTQLGERVGKLIAGKTIDSLFKSLSSPVPQGGFGGSDAKIGPNEDSRSGLDKLKDLFRAGGGPVSKGQPYVVGEKRPELFVPDRNGSIVPDLTNMPGETRTVVNNYYNTAVHPSFSGIVARSRAEWRDIMADGIEAVNEDLKARGISLIAEGKISGSSTT